MSGSSLIALIDDIATLLDDVALMTKVAAKKTAGVLGDDLALNAKQVAGLDASRELPVVWAVAKGSLVNKAILVPAALILSTLTPWAVIPLMMVGGAFLCYEGVEKIAHRLLGSKDEDKQHHVELIEAIANAEVDMVEFEKGKIKGAVRTDFILSAEIIVITLGTVAQAEFSRQLAVLIGISIIITFGVYGLVAAIVKLDDGGLFLSLREGEGLFARCKRALGRVILHSAPYLMKTLSVVGTAAMFLVGGNIISHNIPVAHSAIATFAHGYGTFAFLFSMLADAIIGIVVGSLVVTVVMLFDRVRRLLRKGTA